MLSSAVPARAVTLTSISPSTVPAYSNVTVTLTGSGFTTGTSVLLDGMECMSNCWTATFVNSTQIVISNWNTPAPGSHTIDVKNGYFDTASAPVTVSGSANPVPSILSLSPGSAAASPPPPAASNPFNLTVNGSNFISGSQIAWNGVFLQTTYESSAQLQAQITALQLGTAGIAQVTVFNPAPGGGTSAAASFYVTGSSPNPNTPLLSLVPSSTTAGGAAFTLTVTGTNFSTGTQVLWKGTALTTHYISNTELQAQVPAPDIASPATVKVSLAPPPPDGTVRAATFTVQPSQSGTPLPAIIWVSPVSTTAGTSGATLTVSGANFVSGSQAQWNGANRTTTFVNSNQLTVVLTAGDLANPGAGVLSVVNPSAGGIFDWYSPTSNQWLYPLITPGVTVFPTGPQPTGMAPVAVGVDWQLGQIYVVHRQLFRDVGVDTSLPTDLVTVVNQQNGSVIATIGVGSTANGVGQGIAVDSLRHMVYVTNADDSTVTVIDGVTNTTVATVAVDSSPEGIAVDSAAGIVYVAGSSVTLLDATQQGARLASIPVIGHGAWAVAVDTTTHLAYALVNSIPQSVATIDGPHRAAGAVVTLPSLIYTYTGIAVDPGYRVYACDYNSGIVTPINIANSANPQLLAGFSGNPQHDYVQAIAADPVSHNIFVVGSSLYVFSSGSTPALLKTIALPRLPTAIAVDQNSGETFVTDTDSDTVSVLNTAQQAVTSTIPLGTLSFGLAFDPAAGNLYAANFGADAVSVVDAGTHTVSASWASGAGPWAVAADAGLHLVYALNATAGTLTIFNDTSGSVQATLNLGTIGAGVVAVNSTTHMVYVSGLAGAIAVINPRVTPPTVTTVPVAGASSTVGIAIDETAGLVYVAQIGVGNNGTITVLNSGNSQVGSPWQVSPAVWKLAVDPVKRRLYGTIPMFTIGGPEGLLVLDTTSGASIAQIPGVQPAGGLLPSAEGVAVNPATHHVFVSDAGTGTVMVVDGSLSTPALLKTFVTGTSADGLAVDTTNGLIYAGNILDATIGVFADPQGEAAPSLSATKSHTGNFAQGQPGATYTVTVSNGSGMSATNGTVTLTETLPSGMTLLSMQGNGWNCSANTCTRSDALAGGASYPAIAVTVNVASNAASSLTNQVSVSGGGSAAATASDPTTVTAVCSYSLNPTNATASASGGNATVTVTAAPGCGWTGSSGVNWITVTSGASGSGNGAVNYSVSALSSITGRTGTLTVAGQTFTLVQSGATPVFSLTPTSVNAGSSATTGTVTITGAPSDAPWTALSNAAWITITLGASGTGSGSTGYSIAANASTNSRTGFITIAGQTFTVTQAGTSAFTLNPLSASVGAGAATGSVVVTATPSAASWTAISNAAWITVTSGASGTGNGTVGYSVAANASVSLRGGSLTIAGQTFSLTQSGATPVFSLTPTSVNIGSSATAGTVTITGSPSDAPWTALSNAAWITITLGASGSGSGSTGYSIAANASTNSRTGTITIAGQAFTVTQAGTSAFTLNPLFASVGAGATTGSVAVTATPSTASWTAISNAAWITVTSGASGTGNGTVGYSVAANASVSLRSGSLTIAGQTFTLTQSGATATGQTYTISTIAGGVAPQTPALATAAGLGEITGVAVDSAGNTYLSSSLHCVFKMDYNGMLTRVAGTCRPGFSGDGGPAVNAQLNFPAGLALDAAGDLYIADHNNNRVRKVSTNGTIATVAGSSGSCLLFNGWPATDEELCDLYSVAVDSGGNLYVGDLGAVLKVDASGTATFAVGAGTSGYSGDGGAATNAKITSASGLAFDAGGNLYIADYENNRVRKVTVGGIISTVAGNGSAGYSGDGGPAANAQLSAAQGVSLDTAGNLYIADYNNCAVRKVTASGTISTVAGNFLTCGTFGDGGLATSAALGGPLAVAVDHSGNLYIADDWSDTLRKVSAAGIITSVAGTGPAHSGDGGAATSAQLFNPSGTAMDSAGNLYIADQSDVVVRKVSPGGIISTVAGTGNCCYSGDGGPATSANLDSDWGVAVDSAGNLYIADGSEVRKVNPAGTIGTVAGTGTDGYSGDGGPATAAMIDTAQALAVDSSGNLYIADTYNHRIRKVSPNGTITTVAGTGVAGFAGDGGAGTSARLNYPDGVAVDSAGNVYIADCNNHRIRKLTPGGTITTVAGNGTDGNSGDNGPAVSGTLSRKTSRWISQAASTSPAAP